MENLDTKTIQSEEHEIDFFNFLDKTPLNIKVSIIQNTLIPLMNLRRHKTENMTGDEISLKLNSPANSAKPGEKYELLYELIKSINAEGLNPKIAHELADIAYYGLQPNCNNNDKLENLIMSLGINISFFRVDIINLMVNFCLIKYSTRLNHGDNKNYKEIEFAILNKYLMLHPDLMRLWSTLNEDGPRTIFHQSIESFNKAMGASD